MMNPNLENIQKYLGQYKGQGSNHSQEGFLGELDLETLLGGKGFRLNYRASNDLGDCLHQEVSILAPNEAGLFCLWNFNSNTSAMLCHVLTVDEYTTEGNHLMHFEYGKQDNQEAFRERIILTLHAGGAISYDYAWGLAGEDIGERSSVKLFKTSLA